MVYGGYGSGKTHLLSTASQVLSMGKVLMISIEAGDETTSKFPDTSIVRINQYSQLAEVFEWLRMHCKFRDYEKGNERNQALLKLHNKGFGTELDDPAQVPIFNTVIIDSLTEAQKICMYGLLGISIGNHKLNVVPLQPQFKEWGESAEMIRLLIRSFRDLPMHTLMSVAEQVTENDKKELVYTPLLPGKLSQECQAYFDVVGCFKN